MAFEDKLNRLQQVFIPGVPNVFNIPKGLNILRMFINLRLSVTISGGTTSGIAIREGGALNLIRRIRLIANPAAGSRYKGSYLVDCTPQTLLRYAQTTRNGKWFRGLKNTTLGNGDVGTYDVFVSIPILFGDDNLNNNVQTALNMNERDSANYPVYDQVQLQIETAGHLNEIFYGTDRQWVVTGMLEYGDKRLGLSADTLPLVQEEHDVQIPAANDRFVDQSLPHDGAFTQMLVLAQQGMPARQLSDSLINRFEMSGEALNLKMFPEDVKMAMIEEGFYDPSADLTGQFFFDFTSGILQNSNRANALQHVISVNNPSGSSQDVLVFYTRRVFALPPVTTK